MSSMKCLPDLAIVKIATYLKPKDLIACSAVCKAWRDKFNIDAVWTPHLQFIDKYYNIQARYKDMILCPPDFTTLNPLCDARECYIRDQCLHFNCRAGLYTVESFKPKISGELRQMINIVDKEGNCWLFINALYKIEVWNITNKPVFQSHTEKRMPLEMNKRLPQQLDIMYVLDSKVILVFFNLVQIFSFGQPNFELTFECCVLFDRDSPIMNPDAVEPRLCKSKHIVTGNTLIGFTSIDYVSCLSSVYIHIWDLDNLVKLAKISAVPQDFTLFDQDDDNLRSRFKIEMFKGSYKNVIVVVQKENVVTKAMITILNLEYLRFLNFYKRFDHISIIWCGFLNDHVGSLTVLGHTSRIGFSLSLVDCHGRELVTKNLKKYGVDGSSQVVFCENVIYITTFNKVVSVKKDCSRFKVSTVLENEDFHNMNVNVAGPFVFSACNQGLGQIWDIDNKCQITDLPNFKGQTDVRRLTSLKDVHFPPKIIFPNAESSFVSVLSFW